MSERQYLVENVKLRLDTETRRGLERLAEKGDRTLAAEMRRALRAHVRAAQNGKVEA